MFWWLKYLKPLVFFFLFLSCFCRSPPPEAHCFWPPREWDHSRPRLLFHLPGCPGWAGRVLTWWQWYGSRWVSILSHWWPPCRRGEDGDLHRTAYRRHAPLGNKPRTSALGRCVSLTFCHVAHFSKKHCNRKHISLGSWFTGFSSSLTASGVFCAKEKHHGKAGIVDQSSLPYMTSRE